MKLIVGAGGTKQPGWIPLQASDLDIRDRRGWESLTSPATIDAVLSEHVLEHLFPAEAEQTARNIYEILKPGGYWRIAVPDAYNPNPSYHDFCSPNGVYQRLWQPLFGDFPNHKVFYSVDSLSDLLTSVGFAVRPLEWFTEHGVFRRVSWNQSDGKVDRAFGTTYVKWLWFVHGFSNTSLIVDAIKPS